MYDKNYYARALRQKFHISKNPTWIAIKIFYEIVIARNQNIKSILLKQAKILDLKLGSIFFQLYKL